MCANSKRNRNLNGESTIVNPAPTPRYKEDDDRPHTPSGELRLAGDLSGLITFVRVTYQIMTKRYRPG